MRIEWTGQYMPNAGLLYLSYTDLAYVYDDAGTRVGTVLHLTNGFYHASIDGIRGNDVYTTADIAARVVLELHQKYRA